MSERGQHRWSGWPGAYCLNCRSEDPMEDAIVCRDCTVHCAPGDGVTDDVYCELHTAWFHAMRNCPPAPEDVAIVNALIEADRAARSVTP